MAAPDPASSRTPHVVFGLYLLVATLALVWPGAAWAGERLEPRVLGLPPAFAWTVGWILATFGALLLYHRTLERRRGSR